MAQANQLPLSPHFSDLAEVTTRRSSCEYCRLRKVKCDSVKPICGFCARRGLQECVYKGLPRKRRAPPNSTSNDTTPVSADDTSSKQHPTPPQDPCDERSLENSSSTFLPPTPFQRSESLASFTTDSAQAAALPSPPFDGSQRHRKAQGSSQNGHLSKGQSALDCLGQDSPASSYESSQLLGMLQPHPEDPLLFCLKMGHTHEDVERILQGLMDNRNLILLFCFHFDVIAREFYSFELDLQLSLLAFGSLFIQDPSHAYYYERARAAMIEQLESPTMGCLQALLLLYATSHLRRDMSAAWVLLSMACRLVLSLITVTRTQGWQALLLELDKDPDDLVKRPGYGELTAYDKEKRRRCWWNCYVYELLTATGVCRPRILTKHNVKFPMGEGQWEKLSPYYSFATAPPQHFIAEMMNGGDHPVTHIIKISEVIFSNFKLRILRQFGRDPEDPANETIKALEHVYPEVAKVSSLEQAHQLYVSQDQAIAQFLSDLPPHLLLPLPPSRPSKKAFPTNAISTCENWDHDDLSNLASLWLEEFFKMDPRQPPWTLLCLNYLYYASLIGLHTEWIQFILQTCPDEDDEEEDECRGLAIKQLRKSFALLQHASASLASLSVRLYKHMKRTKFWGEEIDILAANSRKGLPAHPKIPIPYPINMGATGAVLSTAMCYVVAESKWIAARLDQTVDQAGALSLEHQCFTTHSATTINAAKEKEIENLHQEMVRWRHCLQRHIDLFEIVDARFVTVFQCIAEMCSQIQTDHRHREMDARSSANSSPTPQSTASTSTSSGAARDPSNSPPNQRSTVSGSRSPGTSVSGKSSKGVGVLGSQSLSELEKLELPTVQAFLLSMRREIGMVLSARDSLASFARFI